MSAGAVPAAGTRTVVVKVGSSSITGAAGGLDVAAVDKLCGELADLRSSGHFVVLVTSGAIAAGWAALGGGPRPSDPVRLQALSAIGQHRLMRVYDDAFAKRDLHVGQVLLAPLDFAHRQQYLHARQTLAHLLEIGVVPVVNENDATSDDEIRFGDNDRLAALVAHLVSADILVLLTDTAGLFTADPRLHAEASLIEEVVEVDHELEAVAGGPGSVVGSGGMTSKLAAAKIAAWSGVTTVIADAGRPGVLADVLGGRSGSGTVFRARSRRLPARKLWIAFALAPAGTLRVDEGARRALVTAEASLLPAGVVAVEGRFEPDDAVEIAGPDGVVFAKGLVRHPAALVTAWAGRRTSELPEGAVHEVVHRDDLVVLS
jgi:glutamate 5-kinase